MYGHLSKYLADVSKLIIAGVVLATLMQQDIDAWWLIGGGSIAAIGFFFLAYKTFIKSKR